MAEVYFSSNGTGVSASSCSEDGQNIVGNISSYVCEIVGAVGDLWRTESVQSSTESNVSQAVRNAITNQSRSSYSSWTELTELANRNNPNSGILYYDGAGAGSNGTLTLNGMIVPCGAWTVIVENASLRINGNLQYAQTCSDGTAIEDNLPSIAFIVLGGNIDISSSAKHLVGVFYTNQAFTGDDRSAVNGELAIDGSVYGDLQPLLNAANYVGPPTLDGGSLVIRYDSRILLNTPPALSEYVNVSTEEAVN